MSSDTRAQLCTAEGARLDFWTFLLKYKLELHINITDKLLKQDLIMAIFRIPHDRLVLFSYHGLNTKPHPPAFFFFFFFNICSLFYRSKGFHNFRTDSRVLIIFYRKLWSRNKRDLSCCCPERSSAPADKAVLCPLILTSPLTFQVQSSSTTKQHPRAPVEKSWNLLFSITCKNWEQDLITMLFISWHVVKLSQIIIISDRFGNSFDIKT